MTKDPAQKTLSLDVPPVAGEVVLRGVVSAVSYVAPSGTFAVLKLRTGDGHEHVVIGDLAGLAPGEQLRVAGKLEEHPNHGKQLRASSVVPELPTTEDGIQRLLGSGFVDGIGTEMARRIVLKFGVATLDIIADHPDRLREVEGIGPQRATKIQQTFRARRAESETRAFLQAAGVGPALAQRVLRKYGDEAAMLVRNNPYRLATDVHGIGFRTADRIGRALGFSEDDPQRAEGAVLHLLNEAGEQGNTALPNNRLEELAAELGVPPSRVREALEKLLGKHDVVRERELLYPPPLHDAEVELATRLRALERKGAAAIDPKVLTLPTVQRVLEALHPKQRTAVETLLNAALLVLTGGPGTGKTTTVRSVVAVARAAGLRICLCAPTGRAAKRLTEATGEPAKTIHRVLEWNPRLGKFVRGPGNPIEAELVLADEASMLDVVLAAKLLAALKPGARLVLVGDAEQLPSVGPGTVLADLLHTPWIPSVRLTEVFRQAQASAIVRGAHGILRGEVPESSPARPAGSVQAPAGELYLVKADDAERGAQLLIETAVRRIPRSFGLDPRKDVQVLVPTHKGPLGAQALNAALQHELNPAPPTAEGAHTPKFREGDKVMQLRNDYELEVYNGDVGMVLRVEKDSITVQIDGRDVVYTGDAREALALAYAATVHKAQGSEYDAVVIGLHTSHFMLLNRALIYTAVTRAKRLVVLVGSERAFRMAVQNNRTQERHGALRARLDRG